jgi:DNA repair protein RadC
MDARAGKSMESRSTGDRSRLRKRLLDARNGRLPLLPAGRILLTLTIPRIDTKPRVKRLLDDFSRGKTPTWRDCTNHRPHHPSGDPTPSSEDIRPTHDLIKAGRHMEVTVHDHR